MPRIFIKLALLAVIPIAGCSSIKGTLLQRDPCNVGWQKIEGKGIPITLEVPTHLQVIIKDVKYVHKDKNLGWVLLTSGQTTVVTTDVKHDFIKTKKIFMIDPKRPAAGDVDFKIDLAEDQQYLSSIESSITDRTIEESSLAFERLLGALRPSGTGAGIGEGSTNPLSPIESVRAVEIFEIDDPTFEQNVSAFLAQHMCAPTCEQVTHQAVVPSVPDAMETAFAPGLTSPLQ